MQLYEEYSDIIEDIPNQKFTTASENLLRVSSPPKYYYPTNLKSNIQKITQKIIGTTYLAPVESEMLKRNFVTHSPLPLRLFDGMDDSVPEYHWERFKKNNNALEVRLVYAIGKKKGSLPPFDITRNNTIKLGIV